MTLARAYNKSMETNGLHLESQAPASPTPSMAPPPADSQLFTALGAAAAIGIAAALTPVRTQLGQTNAALILVVVIVAAARLGGRVAGVATAFAAALSFNFFFTEPYLTLRISDRQDVIRVLLLFAVGLIVGELAVVGERVDESQAAAKAHVLRLRRVSALVSEGAPVNEIWNEIRDAMSATLHVEGCHFERSDNETQLLAELATSVTDQKRLTFRDGGFLLPQQGCQISVRTDGRVLGRIVVRRGTFQGLTAADRATAATLADLLALALRSTEVPEALL
jgi:K+-sensing histidine kinase KdpD